MASARIMEMSMTWSKRRRDVVNITSLDGLLVGRKIMTIFFFLIKMISCNFMSEPAEMLYPDLYFGTMLHLFLLRDCIGDHHSFKAGIVDTRDGWAREDAMG